VIFHDAQHNARRVKDKKGTSGLRIYSPRHGEEMMSKASLSRGFTLIELIIGVTLLSILCGMAVPAATLAAKRNKERLLRNNLREIRGAIDRYEEGSMQGKFFKAPSYGYPPNLEALVNGVEVRGGYKLRLLREIPVDPMTGNRDWGIHSMEDDPDSDSWDGGPVWDVYSRSQGTALDGTKYREW
jgi:general secretion pathway protein G